MNYSTVVSAALLHSWKEPSYTVLVAKEFRDKVQKTGLYAGTAVKDGFFVWGHTGRLELLAHFCNGPQAGIKLTLNQFLPEQVDRARDMAAARDCLNGQFSRVLLFRPPVDEYGFMRSASPAHARHIGKDPRVDFGGELRRRYGSGG